MVGLELASNGYIVFLMDHLDGSCNYTELQDGKIERFDTSGPSPFLIYKAAGTEESANDLTQEQIAEGKEHWHGKLMRRVDEVSELITQITQKNFLVDFLNATNDASVDAEKIVVSGHSYGGAAAIKVGDMDPRVKSVLAHDPWTSILEPDYEVFDGLLDKPVHILTSS